MLKKLFILIFISQLFLGCGFTPIYMVTNEQNISNLVFYKVNEDTSYTIRQILNEELIDIDKNKAEFIIELNVIEKVSPVNVLSSGSVSEYKIEVLITFKIMSSNDKLIIYESQSRGFANYDVNNSEYNNTLVKNEALKNAITDATQLMNILIRSKINQ